MAENRKGTAEDKVNFDMGARTATARGPVAYVVVAGLLVLLTVIVVIRLPARIQTHNEATKHYILADQSHGILSVEIKAVTEVLNVIEERLQSGNQLLAQQVRMNLRVSRALSCVAAQARAVTQAQRQAVVASHPDCQRYLGGT